jgi:hypothetical protein
MTDQPADVVFNLVLAGAFREAADLAADHGLPAQGTLRATATLLSRASWLARHSPYPDVRDGARSVLISVAGIARRWATRAEPVAPDAATMPQDKAAFDRLMLEILSDQGFYHPVFLPGANRPIPPTRHNAPGSDGSYHAAEWTLVRDNMERACGGTLQDKVIVDAGCADGYFTLQLGLEGARVVALDTKILMALRTATLAALHSLQDRVIVKLGTASDVARIVGNLRSIRPDLGRPDAVCALGLIYHFDDLAGDLAGLTGLGVPILIETDASPRAEEAAFDPARHSDPQTVALPWLVDWLDEHGYEPTHDPRWADTVAGLDGRANSARREMVLAIPRRPAPAHAR